MAAKAKQVPSYQHHKSSGLAFIRYQRDGKRRAVYLGKYGSQESREAYAGVLADIGMGREPEKPNVKPAESEAKPAATIGDVVKWFLDDAESYYRKRDGSATSELAACKTVCQYLSPFEQMPADKFGLPHLKGLRDKMLESSLSGRQLSRSAVNCYVRKLQLVFRRAASNTDLVPAGVATNLSLLEPLKAGRSTAAERGKVMPVMIPEVLSTLPHAPVVVADMARVQLLTGMRPGEICALKVSEIDRSGKVWKYVPSHHKTLHAGKERIILIGPDAQEILQPYLDPSQSACFVAIHPRKAEPTRYRVDSYRNAIQRAAKRAGVPRWPPNQLRHTAATGVQIFCSLKAKPGLYGAVWSFGLSQPG